MNTDISLITVCTNEKELLKKCLRSIYRNKTSYAFEVIVVDNASTDGTNDYIKKTYPNIRLIIQKKRRGFAKNNNYALKKAKGDYILLLNPDTELHINTLEALTSFMKITPDAGICGPKLLFPDGTLQYSCRRFPTWKSVLARRTPFRNILQHTFLNKTHILYEKSHNKLCTVDWILGACFMIRKNVIHDIGILDPQYYLYVDDIDYCLRAWQNGWKVYYVPTVTVVHHHKAESDKNFISSASYQHFKSMIYFISKHGLPPFGTYQ